MQALLDRIFLGYNGRMSGLQAILRPGMDWDGGMWEAAMKHDET